MANNRNRHFWQLRRLKGGWWQKIIFLSVYYHNKRLHVKFGCSRAVLKFGGWQLKNGKITGKKWKIGQKSVKEWSNGLDLTIYGNFPLLQDSPIKKLGL